MGEVSHEKTCFDAIVEQILDLKSRLTSSKISDL